MTVPRKILAIKFKYLGDVAIMVPALRSIKEKWPDCELHALVAEEAVPALKAIPWIKKVWSFPRIRGKSNYKASFPVIKNLRFEKFDRSVDFVGNDRGAFVSFLIGAKRRLASAEPRWKPIRTFCYHEQIEELDTTRHEIIRDIYILSQWGIKPSSNLELELPQKERKDIHPSLHIHKDSIVCHLSTSVPKKEWSLNNWVQLHSVFKSMNKRVYFSTGPSDRELALLNHLNEMDPSIHPIPKTRTLYDFIDIVSQAKLFISPDTAPLHIAAALGIPTHGLFGPTAGSRWAPPGETHTYSQVLFCACSGHKDTCDNPIPCIDRLTVEEVLETVQDRI